MITVTILVDVLNIHQIAWEFLELKIRDALSAGARPLPPWTRICQDLRMDEHRRQLLIARALQASSSRCVLIDSLVIVIVQDHLLLGHHHARRAEV